MAPSFTNENSLFNFVVWVGGVEFCGLLLIDGNGVKRYGWIQVLHIVPRFNYSTHPTHRINKQNTTVSPENMTIDLSELEGPKHDQVVKSIAHAAETLGFFQVVNHGVPLELLESLKVSAHQFFNQPSEKKAVEVALEYIKTSTEMVKRLLHALMGNLGVKLDDSRLDALLGLRMVNMNFYPTCPNPDLTVGVGRHSDMGTLTVLLQDGIGGLYVKIGEDSTSGNEDWIEIPPVHGALVINIGDALQIISNGRYRSAEHRVRTTSVESRVSVPIFNAPLPVVKIGPLPEVVARDGMARYREVIFEEFMNNFFGKSHEDAHSCDDHYLKPVTPGEPPYSMKINIDFEDWIEIPAIHDAVIQILQRQKDICRFQMAPSFNDENSLFNFVVKDGNGVKGLVDSGLTQVPGQYIQPPNHRINKQNATVSLENMTIDLSKLDGPNHDQVVKSIAHAAETLGFFQVVNHGVPIELLESLKASAHQFFNQPSEKKAVYLKGVSPSPMVKYGTSFVPEKEKALEWKDYISMIYTNDADALEFWPNECKEVALEYIKTSNEMVKKLLHALMDNLGVKLDDSRLDALMGLRMVNMNFYPTCPNPDLTVGVGRHSDMGTLTVLLQDGIGGLYVKKGEDSSSGNEDWIEISTRPCNGRYKSAEHRVRTTSVESRVSVPIFNAPLPMVKIGPLPEVVARDGVARYRELIFEEYMNNFFGKSHDGKKSLDFATI
ncbi:2-oxoglutarate (2OG) and Fe(II)-dependent oxygenase superfamily protein [Tanacetum coccineum]